MKSQVIHPGYVRAVESKLVLPAEIYSYPAKSRLESALKWRPLKAPAIPSAPVKKPSLRPLWAAYAGLGLVLWIVAAVVPGA